MKVPFSDQINNAEKTGKSSPFYLPELDILRFFAFFAVFIHHSLPQSPDAYQGKLAAFSKLIAATVTAGGFGVDLFFALSSFLITELLIREFEKTEKINAVAFYARRALRILPLYYTFVLLAIFVLPRFLPDESLGFPYDIGFLTIFANWVCAFFGYPDSVAAPLWSISIEEQFYLVFPFLVMFFGVPRLKKLAFCFLGIAIITRFILFLLGTPHPGVWCNTFARLDPIAGGILLTLLLRSGRLKPIFSLKLRALLYIAGLVLYVLAAMYFDYTGLTSLVLYPAAALASVLIIWSAISPQAIKINRYKIFIYLGRISYGLYIFHLLGIKVSGLMLKSFTAAPAVMMILHFSAALLLTIIISMISYNILEKPFLKLKKKFTFIQSRPA